ncbi:unnamed protein product [Coccothraustes coccothraustes]
MDQECKYAVAEELCPLEDVCCLERCLWEEVTVEDVQQWEEEDTFQEVSPCGAVTEQKVRHWKVGATVQWPDGTQQEVSRYGERVTVQGDEDDSCREVSLWEEEVAGPRLCPWAKYATAPEPCQWDNDEDDICPELSSCCALSPCPELSPCCVLSPCPDLPLCPPVPPPCVVPPCLEVPPPCVLPACTGRVPLSCALPPCRVVSPSSVLPPCRAVSPSCVLSPCRPLSPWPDPVVNRCRMDEDVQVHFCQTEKYKKVGDEEPMEGKDAGSQEKDKEAQEGPTEGAAAEAAEGSPAPGQQPNEPSSPKTSQEEKEDSAEPGDAGAQEEEAPAEQQ